MDTDENELIDENNIDIKRYGQAVLALAGILLLGWGIVGWFGTANSDDEVEVILSDEVGEGKDKENDIVIDVSGAVDKPGVYVLKGGSRVGDALEAAGGLTEKADQAFVQQKINLAQIAVDGSKVFVPFVGESPVSANADSVQGGVVGSEINTINVNSASMSELISLSGIGQSRAQSIVDNRPYNTIEEVKTKAGIPSNVFETIKDKLSLY